MAEPAEKAKKRKRTTDGSSRPSKRVAFEGEKNVLVSLVEPGQSAPVIATTPGLAIPPSVPLTAYTKRRKNTPIRPSQKDAISSSELLLHSSAHPKLDYIAREEDAGADSFLKHYVGVYDPETGKLELMEARKMVVRGSVRAHQATDEDKVSADTREQRNVLGQTFGTKKAKKSIASVVENAIGPSRAAMGDKPVKLDAAAQAMIASMAEATAGMSTLDELTAAADAAKPRPKANMNATTIDEVYTHESLIGEDIFKHIPALEWQQAIKNKTEVKVSSRYVAHHIQKVGGNVEKLRMLRYLLCLLDFYNVSKPKRSERMLPRREELAKAMGNVPSPVVESIKRKFSDGPTISKFNVDRLITYVCALACLVDGYEVDMWDLKEDLKLEMKQMGQYFQEIGARIVAMPEAHRRAAGLDKAAASVRKFARLRLPLEFPKVSVGRRQR